MAKRRKNPAWWAQRRADARARELREWRALERARFSRLLWMAPVFGRLRRGLGLAYSGGA